jgi:hypothetical protein
VESTLTEVQLVSLFSTPETAAEQAIVADYQAAAGNFEALPDWATETAAQTAARITGAIFNGQTAAQMKASIDAQLTNITTANVSQINARLAVMRTLLGNAVDAIVAVRTILVAMGKALIYLRDLIVRVRR